jgi:hypothetical protein
MEHLKINFIRNVDYGQYSSTAGKETDPVLWILDPWIIFQVSMQMEKSASVSHIALHY